MTASSQGLIKKASELHPTQAETAIIRSVEIKSFRGIPQKLVVGLSADGRPSPVVISGDSGSGKSSIVEAVEFACQGTIGGSIGWTGAEVRSPWSFAVDTDAVAFVRFSNGAAVRRGLSRSNGGQQYASAFTSRSGDLPLLDMARMSWRREDVITFLAASSRTRGRVFASYFERTIREMALGDPRLRRAFEAADGLLSDLDELRQAQDRDIESLLYCFRLPSSSRPRYRNLPHWLSDRSRELEGARAYRIRDITRATDLIDTVARRYEQINEEKARRGLAEGEFRRLQRVEASGGKAGLLMHELMRDISEELTKAFNTIAPTVPVERIDVFFGRRSMASLELEVQLSNGIRCSPHNIFSEGYLDLLAILFFTTVAEEAAKYGQARILILDDVVQSVDAPLRTLLFHYIAQKLSGWQLIVTVHDRLWREQLIQILRQYNPDVIHCEVRNWSFETGPALSGGYQSPADPLKTAIAGSDPRIMCTYAGLLAEHLCDRLSIALGTSVRRRDGDRYTLGDMWPGILKALRRTEVAPEAEELGRWIYLRNMVGAHQNEWATPIPHTDAQFFAEAALQLLHRFYCEECLMWIKARDGALSCRCGAVTMQLPATRSNLTSPGKIGP